jgi:hypothetical protein
MSGLIYIHKNERMVNKNDVITRHDESIIDGKKGLSFKLYSQNGDKREKFVGKSNPNGTFKFIVINNGEKKEEDELNLKDLLAIIKKIKGLKFVVDYLESIPKATQKGGKKKRCLHGSEVVCPYTKHNLKCPFKKSGHELKRASKKSSRKGSKKGSRNHMRRMSGGKRRVSRKTSRKTSRKGSRKTSRKASRKHSRK